MDPRPATPWREQIVGSDPGLTALLARVARVAPTRFPVLIRGESGTGKELVARAVHELGGTPRGPFVAVNCGALPRELAESELFGHERGAFTGATAARSGWFEEAHGGTILLDELGELPLELQPKLLRVLETGRFRRVGGRGEVGSSVRIVAATNRDLRAEAERGRFRLDLYHRVAGVEIELPPLRDRRGDVPLLAYRFLDELVPEMGTLELTPGALQVLVAHDWPGNVRELRNVLRRAAVLAGPCIDAAALMDELGPSRSFDERSPRATAAGARAAGTRAADADAPGSPSRPPGEGPSVDAVYLPGKSFADIERDVFCWALARNGGSRRRAALALGISRSTFCDRVRRLRLPQASAVTCRQRAPG